MVKDAKLVVKRGQSVKVKVISMAGSKIALSMKEVDQSNGKDLLPERGARQVVSQSGHNEYSNPSRPPPGSYFKSFFSLILLLTFNDD